MIAYLHPSVAMDLKTKQPCFNTRRILSLPSHRILSLAVAMPCRMLAITSVIWKMVVLWENHRKTMGKWWVLHTGKHIKNYGKSQYLLGKSTISMGHFQ